MKKFHISTYLSIIITSLAVCSTLVVSGVFYINITHSLAGEFEERVKAEGREMGLAMKNRLVDVQTRLRELSLDNTVRVTLMLGADHQLQEYLTKVYGEEKATQFFVLKPGSKTFFNASGISSDKKILSSLLNKLEGTQALRLNSQNQFTFTFSRPIVRQQEQIGTAACIYYFQKDDVLSKRIGNEKQKRLAFLQGDKTFDLFTNQRLSLHYRQPEAQKASNIRYLDLDGRPVATIDNIGFPDVIYIASLDSLKQAKRGIFFLVFISASAVIILSIFSAFLLGRKLALPLQRLTKLALEVSEGGEYLDADDISSNIIEVDQLLSTLSTMVVNLRKAEELRRYQQLFEGVADTVVIHDFSGNIIEANKIASDQFGFSRSELLQMNLLDILPESQHERIRDIFSDLSHEREQQIFETEIRTKLDKIIFATCNARRITFRNEEVCLIVVHDITARWDAEKALFESKEKFRSVVDNSHDGIIIVDDNYKLEYVNDEFANITGQVKKELIGKNFQELFEGESKELIMARYERRQRGEDVPSSYELDIKRPNGETRRVELHGTIMYDTRGRSLTVAQMLDITDKRSVEQALKQSERKYRTILNKVDIGYYEADIAGNVTFVSDATCKIFEAEREDLKGLAYNRYTSDETARKLVSLYGTIASTGSPEKSFQYQITTGGGKHLTVQTSVALMKNQQGNPAGFSGLIIDVTVQRGLEARLRRAQKMEAIGTLAGGVAHDLNNILSGIVSYPDLLLMDMPDDSPLKKPILTIRKSGEKAAAIVQDMLTLARRAAAVKEVSNLNLIVNEYLKSLEIKKLRTFHDKVVIEQNLEPDLLNILGSPIHLSKTVMNLVSNAAESMPDGGKISITTQNRYIDHKTEGYERVEEGDYVVLKVQDNGKGIEAGDLEKIFEPFYTTKIMGRSGTGLGMAVVWGAVKDHNGYIDVESLKGKGTTFTLYFPATRKELPHIKDGLPIDDYRGNGEAILVVDDVLEQREIASQMLRRLGYAVHTVSSGEKAVEYLTYNYVNLLILDMIMEPGIDGLETYKRILKTRPGQRAVIASGYSENNRVKNARKLGAGQYIKKPYTLEKIAAAVKAELIRTS